MPKKFTMMVRLGLLLLVIAALLSGAAAANPHLLADEIVGLLKKGGIHDKKD